VTLGERGPGALPIVFGASAHIGEEEFDSNIPGIVRVNEHRKTWSLNADVRIPITDRLGFQGEFFTGENLGAFLGGIGQGMDRVTLEDISSTGGWCEIWYDWTSRFHSHVGYSIDDPDNDDVSAGGRIYNRFYFVNFVYDITKNFIAGIEISDWDTHYQDLLPGESLRTEFVMKYGF
jgi:hypothetical protein